MAQESVAVLTFENHIKANKKTDYDKWLNDVFLGSLIKSKNEQMIDQHRRLTVYRPAKAESDGTWTYQFVMDPSKKNDVFDFAVLLTEFYAISDVDRLLQQESECVARPSSFRRYLKDEGSQNYTAVRSLFTRYIQDLNSPNWKQLLPPYLTRDVDAFMESHATFRNALQDYHSEIKHLVVEGNKAMAWLRVRGRQVGYYEGLISGVEKDEIKINGQLLE